MTIEQMSDKKINVKAYNFIRFNFSRSRLRGSIIGFLCTGIFFALGFIPYDYFDVRPGLITALAFAGLLGLVVYAGLATTILNLRRVEDLYYQKADPSRLKKREVNFFLLIILTPVFSLIFLYYIFTEMLALFELKGSYTSKEAKEFGLYLFDLELTGKESYNVKFAKWFFFTEEIQKLKEIQVEERIQEQLSELSVFDCKDCKYSWGSEEYELPSDKDIVCPNCNSTDVEIGSL